LRYQDLRMARTALKDPESMRHMAEARSKLDFVPCDDPPSELMPEPARLKEQTAKAPLLRKLIDKAFAQLFAPRKTKQPCARSSTRDRSDRRNSRFRSTFSTCMASCIGGSTCEC
jgi:hypothetical protein